MTSGDVWYVELFLLYSGNNATGDYKFDFTFPSSSGWYRYVGDNTTANAILVSTGVRMSALTAFAAAVACGTDAAHTPRMLKLEMMLRPTADGTCQFRFANNAAAAGRTSRTVAGTVLRAVRVDPNFTIAGSAGSALPMRPSSSSTDANNATVGGDQTNAATGEGATVSGGIGNVASGMSATVAGGFSNEAAGNHSFAAGHRAKAAHAGAFVWGDTANEDFISTADDQFLIRAAGGVGIGTNIPARMLEIADTQSIARLTSTESSAGSVLELNSLARRQDAIGAIDFLDNGFLAGRIAYLGTENAITFSTDAFERVRIDAAGQVGIGVVPQYPLHLSSGAYCTAGGSWTNASDRNLKENFASIDERAVLNALLTVPVTRWNYKVEEDSVQHIGPTAQDFRSAFGLGDGSAAISTVDASGVALASIQALHQIAMQQQSLIESQQCEIDELRQRLERIEAKISGSTAD